MFVSTILANYRRPRPSSWESCLSKTRSSVELVVVAGLILAAIWLAPLHPDRVVAKRLGYGFALGAFAIAIVSPFLHRDGLRDIGLRFDNFLQTLGWVMIPTVVLVAVLLVTGYGLHSLHFGRHAFD